MSEETTKVRIHKYLAAKGVASRRTVEEMLTEGRITVNGRAPTRLPCFVEPGVDEIRVDGRRIAARQAGKVYFLLNKPKGVVCTQSDPQGRTKAADLIPAAGKRVYCVGRLDADSTGLIVLTNDGELTQQLTHPSYGVAKTYHVEIDGSPTSEELTKLKGGTWLDGKRTQRVALKVLRRGPNRSLLAITLTEGKNREIRRMLARLGHKVRKLKRVAIGPITDRGLKIGSSRPLRPAELAKLTRSAGLGQARTKKTPRVRRRK